MEHKFLNDLGIVPLCDRSAQDLVASHDSELKWVKQRLEYGFDSRDTWSLKDTMLELLYERVCLYVEEASNIVDLTYHTYEFEGKTYNQLELINLLLENAKIYFWDVSSLNTEFKSIEESMAEELKANEAEQKVWDIWALIHKAMWW